MNKKNTLATPLLLLATGSPVATIPTGTTTAFRGPVCILS